MKLIDGTPEAIMALRAAQPGLRVVPVVFTGWPWPRARRWRSRRGRWPRRRAPSSPCASCPRRTAARWPGARRAGVHRLRGPSRRRGHNEEERRGRPRPWGSSKKLERLYVLPRPGSGICSSKRVTVTTASTLSLKPLDVRRSTASGCFAGASTILEDGDARRRSAWWTPASIPAIPIFASAAGST